MLARLEPLKKLARHSVNSADSSICPYAVDVMTVVPSPS